MNSSVRSRAPSPQLARTRSSTDRWTSSVATRAPRAKVPYSIRRATRSGCRTANVTADRPVTRDGEQRHRLLGQLCDDRLQIEDIFVDREVESIARGKPAALAIEPDHACCAARARRRSAGSPRSPTRRRDAKSTPAEDQERPLAETGIRQPPPVRAQAKLDWRHHHSET